MRKLNIRVDEFNPKELSAGDVIYLTGIIYTLRDKACKRLLEESHGFELNIVYNAGPIFKGGRILSIGPTTTSRMENYLRKLIKKYNIKGIIGKGGIGKDIIRENGICYMLFTGGAGSLAAKYVKKICGTFLDELGEAERVYKIYVENFGPLIVAIDRNGNSIFRQV